LATTNSNFKVKNGLDAGGTITGDKVVASNNGNGQNFQVGDDVWLGDINVANTMSLKGQQSATSGYIRFGGDTNSLGYDGTKFLYAGNLVQARAWVFSNANATSATTNTAQSIFQSGARSYSLDAGSTYYFRLNLGVNFTYSAVPAAIQLVPTFSQVPVAINYSASFISGTSGGVQSFRTTSTSAVSVSPTLSATTTGSTILIEGFLQSNATTGGTVEFKYQINTGGGSSATATTGSLLQIQKIGTGAPGIVSGAWA
jgi:hypothetical protein